ncbi:MarR family winged helix-turn-helix transcriptional regulator [Sabulicella rubraurantiaca]|uniref:MarR family winged helix-turn-helix transcriptional regulator n=1 Tax=Sabulicella rubraurantiaca TaxID=2811429 RepID=UPI001A964613|nr:MarR family transcriptional regulator [Sabulicella rubraurantiaca]
MTVERHPTEARRSLGWLLRLPYAQLSERVYGGLAARGFPDIRTAHGAVFRHILPSGSRLTELAEAAGMTKQGMAYLVEGLTGAGYLESRPDPADGRARRIHLTRRGQAVMEALLELSEEAEEEFGRRIGAAKLARLRTLLEELAEELSPAKG